MEKQISEQAERIFAQSLRKRLEGRVPSYCLDMLSDADLVRKHREHHKIKLSLLADAAKKSESASAS